MMLSLGKITFLKTTSLTSNMSIPNAGANSRIVHVWLYSLLILIIDCSFPWNVHIQSAYVGNGISIIQTLIKWFYWF